MLLTCSGFRQSDFIQMGDGGLPVFESLKKFDFHGAYKSLQKPGCFLYPKRPHAPGPANFDLFFRSDD